MATPVKWGSEFLLDSYITNDQQFPAITGLADGRFVALWGDNSQTLGDASGEAIHAQIFNADGSRAGAEFLVNSGTDGNQAYAKVAALADGGFVATWSSFDQSQSDVYAQIFKADGSKAGVEFLVNTTTPGVQFLQDVAPLAGGGFVVAWGDRFGASDDVRAQLFGANGAKVGSEFLVNTMTAGDQDYPAVAALTNGRFVVAWDSGNGQNDVVHLQMFDANGTKFGAELPVTQAVLGIQQVPQVAALANGRFIVTWSNYNNGDEDVHAQIFNADGTRSGVEFSLDTTDLGVFSPDVTALPDGRFVVTAISSMPNNGYASIVAQLFNADGTKSGSEFTVNTTTAGEHGYPKVAALEDGRLVVAWEDFLDNQGLGGDGSGYGVRAQIFDPRDSGINKAGTALNDDLIGTDFNDTMKGAGGDDHLNAMSGDDTALFSHNFNDYSVSTLGIELKVDGPEGHDTLRNFEHLQFADTTVDVKHDADPLFDTLYYLSRNGDVFHAGVNAHDHFNGFGWHEGRDPNPFFDTSEYLAVYKDAAASGMNPLQHYHEIGWKEGHDPSANFDTKLYLIHNPDVAAAGIDPLLHFLQSGAAEGRQAYQAIGDKIVGGFDAEYYLRHNPDVAAAGVDPLAHFQQYGWHEGRNPNAEFDAAGYLAHYADAAASGMNPLDHYEQIGWKEGHDPSAHFDTAGYLAANPDVAAAGVNPLDHYLQFGIYEGRHAVNDGAWH